MKYLFSLFFMILVFLKGDAFALVYEEHAEGGFSVEISVNSNKIPVLDVVKLNLKLKYPQEFEPNIQKLKSNILKASGFNLPPFRIKNAQIGNDQIEKNQITKEIYFELDPQVTGIYFLTFLDIQFLPKDKTVRGEKEKKDKSEKNVTIISPIIKVDVVESPNFNSTNPISEPLMTLSPDIALNLSLENRENLFYDKSNLDREFANNEAILKEKKIPWLGILTLLFGFYIIYKILNAKPIESTIKISGLQLATTSQEIATENLAMIRNIPNPPKELLNEFYVSLTDAVRFYMDDKYNVHAPNMTSEEVMDFINEHPTINLDKKMQLSQFLVISDKVKFTNYSPTLQECEASELMVNNLIKN